MDHLHMRWLGLLIGVLGLPGAVAGEPEIVGHVARFLRTDDRDTRTQLVAQITADPAYDRSRVSTWLHQAAEFPPQSAGRQTLVVPLLDDTQRTVVLRIPANYDAQRPWPLILALHGQGGNGDGIIGYVERVLGAEVEQFIIAAPDDYREVLIHHAYWPPVAEFPTLLHALRRAVHLDSDCVYVLGYSRGGHTAWTLAVTQPDQFAGVVPLAGYFNMLYPEQLWGSFVPNLAHLPVLCVWGADDVMNADGSRSARDGIAGMNRSFDKVAQGLGVKLEMVELPDCGHSDVVPPAAALHTLLTQTRVHSPEHVQHTFRHSICGSAYWVEVDDWRGDQWTDEKRRISATPEEVARNEVLEKAARLYRGLLGEADAQRTGQQIALSRKHFRTATVWLHEGMVNWDEPVELKVSGRVAFTGRIAPDLYVCLSQAARTWDFDRLRWAGLRYDGTRTTPVDATTEFPTLAELRAAGK